MTRRVLKTSMAAVALFAAPVALGALAPAGAATATPTPNASASGYAVPTDPGTVTAAVIYTGDRVGFSGGGFKPFSAITISADIQSGGSGLSAVIPAGVVGTETASASGTFGTALTLTVVGHTTLTATGVGTDGKAHSDVSIVTVLPLGGATPTATAVAGSTTGPTVQPTTQVNAGVLPKTGADNVGIELWFGGGLLLVGGAVTVVAMSRRRTGARL